MNERRLAYLLAEAYDKAGNADSAAAYYELYLDTHHIWQLFQDSSLLPAALRRLGELHEERRDRERAVEYYGWFVELWNDADPELQPLVEDVPSRER